MTKNNRTFPAIRIEQGETRMYLTYMTGKDIADGISQPDAWTPQNKDGYQRQPVQTRFRKIARYLMGKDGAEPLLPQAVLLNSRDKKLKFIPTDGGDVGTLEIPESATLYEVDGQHRFGGVRYAVDQDPSLAEFPVPVVITEGLPQLDEAVLFYIVNTEQKRVPTDLAQRLIEQQMQDEDLRLQIVAAGKDWIPKATKVVDYIVALPDHPWTNNIGIPGTKVGKVRMKQVSFVTSMKPILTTGIYASLDPEDIGKLLIRYWQALEEVYPEAFADPDEYVIQKTAGVFPLHIIAPEVFEMVRTSSGRITKEELVEVFTDVDKSLGKDYEAGSIFWHRNEGEAGKYAGAKGFRVLADLLRQRLPAKKKVKVV
jgi:DGQHR domain-containing protein